MFQLSDATSLLLRLEMEGVPKGIDLKDRWRETGKMYEAHLGDLNSAYFYAFHAMAASLFGEHKVLLGLGLFSES